jgi:3-deoxy-7-phosphoheptulonate synthase
VILRGGKEPNYDAASVDAPARSWPPSGVPGKLMVDFSHANSRKQYKLQVDVARDVAGQMANGEDRIIGVMVESHLKEGRQDLKPGKPSWNTARASPMPASAGKTASPCSTSSPKPCASAA